MPSCEKLKKLLVALLIAGVSMGAPLALAQDGESSIKSLSKQVYEMIKECDEADQQPYLERLVTYMKGLRDIDAYQTHYDQRTQQLRYRGAIIGLGDQVYAECVLPRQAGQHSV